MGLERQRIVEVHAAAGDVVGTGYLIADGVVLAAAHLGAARMTDDGGDPSADQSPWEVRPLGRSDWAPARLVWSDEHRDVALLRSDDPGCRLAPGASRLRVGVLTGVEPVACTAVGFPWAQSRPDGVRDTEQLFGQAAPLTGAKTGRPAVTVVTAAPNARGPDGSSAASPWAGMSGAALFAGPFLLGVLVADPARYGTDRLIVAPLAPLLADPGFRSHAGLPETSATPVGARFRLEFTAGLSVVLAPPYRPLPDGLDLAAAPVLLLLAEHGVVPFLGRDGLLDELQSWCHQPKPLGLRVVTGGGGSGKTRLAAQLCVRLAGQGWDTGFADTTTAGGTTGLELERPTLLVVDDADLAVELTARVLKHLAYQPGTPPVRLLLLARRMGGWWRQLSRDTQGFAEGFAAHPLPLDDRVVTDGEPARHYRAAVGAFRAHLPVAAADPTQADLAPGGLDTPLLVHMTALLDVLGDQQTATGAGVGVRERVLTGVLNRERQRWAVSRPPSLSDLDPAVAERCVVVATLTAPDSEAHAAALLQAVPALADAAATERRHAIAGWLRTLYPGGGYLGPLRPDPLAEQLLGDADHLGDLAVAIHDAITSVIQRVTQLEALLAELTRAAAVRPGVREALQQLVDQRLPQLLRRTVAQAASGLPGLLASAVRLAPNPRQAAQLQGGLPQYSTVLVDLAAALAEQAVEHYRALAETDPAAHLPDLAMALDNLAVRLAELGQREEALAAVEEAVEHHRGLAETDPAAHLPSLAMALDILAVRLAELGRREEALAPAEEAVERYRGLATTDPAYLPSLAMVLSNTSNRLAGVGRREEALKAVEEAVAIHQPVADGHPAVHVPDLGGFLNNLSNRLAQLGRREEALASAERAVEFNRALAKADPAAHLPKLAGSLHTLAKQLGELGRREEALPPIQEAVAIRRALAQASPSAHLPDLAGSLHNLSSLLAELGRREEALPPIEEAVAIRRLMADANPTTYLPDLAGSLHNLSNRLVELGRREEALPPIQEAVAIRQPLADTNPTAHLPSLAMSLNNLSNLLAEVGRREEALPPIEEAVKHYRALADVDPAAYLPGLSMALHNLSNRLAQLGRREAALPPIQGAVAIRRQLATADRATHLPDLAGSLNNLSNQLAQLGRREAALAPAEEAVERYRALAKVDPAAHLSGLALALDILVVRLAELGRREAAVAPAQEAVEHYRTVTKTDLAAHLPSLAMALDILVVQLAELGRREEALAPAEEAVERYRALAMADSAFLPDLDMALQRLTDLQDELGASAGSPQ